MSIVKMQAVTIAGAVDDFDHIVSKYVCNRDIHIENALTALSKKKKLHTFSEENIYEPIVQRVETLMTRAGMQIDLSGKYKPCTVDYMNEFLDNASAQIEDEEQKMEIILNELKHVNDLLDKIVLLDGIDSDLTGLDKFEFSKFQFGSMPYRSYHTLKTYLNDMEAIFIKTHEEERSNDSWFVWGFYFVPECRSQRVEEVFSSLYFEPMDFPPEFCGVPSEIKEELLKKKKELEECRSKLSSKIRDELKDEFEDICNIYYTAKQHCKIAMIKKNAVHSDNFFYIVGWMPRTEAKKLDREIKASGDTVLFVSSEPDKAGENMTPPTKLRNNPIFRPFEFFVKMYGMPSYNELDPTPVLALTYILFFGIMFGDVGQSAILAIAGFIVYFKKKIELGGIMGMVGISGVVFGFVYGSIFGNEEILPHLISPMHSINQMLIITIAMGVFFIFMGLMLNVINSFRTGKTGEAVFGHNGIAGIVFYATLICALLSKLLKLFEIPTPVIAVLLILSILAMYLSEPLSKLIRGSKNWLPKDGMFYVENLFEMFEVILSYMTNTISFLRIGAFAIVHVGMMMVVAVLAEGGGIGGIIVNIIGNILVMCLEGLIVGIQVLRLEYYEMFSRYFDGQGREFVSLKNKNN